MKRTSIYLTSFMFLTIVGLSACYGQNGHGQQHLEQRDQFTSFDGTQISSKALDQFIEEQMNALDMPGLSIAVINDAKIVYHRTFGVTNTQNGQAIDDETVFEAASMSKPVLAYFAMAMVEDGLLDLDTPLHKYLPNYDLDYDKRYEQITARMVLNHTTGMPNWRYENKMQYLNLKFDPGTQFSYSGEGYEYLGNVIAHLRGGTRTDLEAWIKKEVFEPAGADQAHYLWNEFLEEHKASGHVNGMPNNIYQPLLPSMAGGLHIDAVGFAQFMIAMMNEDGLDEASYDELFSTQWTLPDDHDFVVNYDQSEWSLGFAIEPAPDGNIYAHGGNNGDFQSYFEFSKDKKMGYVFLSNSNVGERFTHILKPFLRTGSPSELDKKYDVVDRRIKGYEDEQFKGVELTASSGDGFAWINDQAFSEGTIEMDIKGENNPGASFVGIAFHGEDRNTFEGIYFRPFNFRSDDAGRRSHSVQYHSLPEHSWRVLRSEFPDAYEAEIPIPPDPDGWFHARIEVEKTQITVYVDDIKEPVLQVESLSGRTSGKIGLWVGSNSSGRFANVQITER